MSSWVTANNTLHSEEFCHPPLLQIQHSHKHTDMHKLKDAQVVLSEGSRNATNTSNHVTPCRPLYCTPYIKEHSFKYFKGAAWPEALGKQTPITQSTKFVFRDTHRCTLYWECPTLLLQNNKCLNSKMHIYSSFSVLTGVFDMTGCLWSFWCGVTSVASLQPFLTLYLFHHFTFCFPFPYPSFSQRFGSFLNYFLP